MARHLVGVDGCKAGWTAVSIIDGEWRSLEVFASLVALWEVHEDADRILVDMPIGLLTEGSEERQCERLVRRMLGPRRSSVFRVPCRDAVYASSREERQRLNRERTGKSLSVQCLAIVPRIREVDCLLRANSRARQVFFESHPELVFCMLNGGHSMKRNKRSPEGQEERMRVLLSTGAVPRDGLDCVLRQRDCLPAPRPGHDDILDALALAVAARVRKDSMMRIPRNPPLDDAGLPMQMVY